MSYPKNRADRDRRRLSFDSVAELYDEVRPVYPEALTEDIIRLSGIGPEGSILEIGCGTGQATMPFARRGFRMVCLEPGRRMARIARSKLRPYPRIEVHTLSFEEWQPGGVRFDLITAAQSFHWVDPEQGYSRAARALSDTGSIALFWHSYSAAEIPLRHALDAVYAELAPEIEDRRTREHRVPNREQELRSGGLFGEVVVRRYPWRSKADADRYLKFLATQSDHIVLDPGRRAILFEAIRGQVERHGGIVEIDATVELFFARKRRLETRPAR